MMTAHPSVVLLRYFLLGVPAFILGCSESGGVLGDKFPIEPKYTLKECMVRLDFEVGNPNATPSAGDFVDRILVAMSKANGEDPSLPMLLGHATGGKPNFVLYYADECERREELTRRFMSKYVDSQNGEFPKYSIVTSGIEPGLDGATPSGLWLEGPVSHD
jgi:hypothetical protein